MDELRDTRCVESLSRSRYAVDRARLDSFAALEEDWKELFRWLLSVGGELEEGVCALWRDHVLTVLVEIVCKDAGQYKQSFIRSRGTSGQESYARDLEAKIRGWIARLDNFLRSRWQTASHLEPDAAAVAATEIRARLENALRDFPLDEDRAYYQMWTALGELGAKCDRYVAMAEQGGDLDPALALLLTYVRYYAQVAAHFNRRITSLPEFYHREILHAARHGAVPDCAGVRVESALPQGFVLPAGTAFSAGEAPDGGELTYLTTDPEYISPVRLESVEAVFRPCVESGARPLCRKPLPSGTCTRLFSADEATEDAACGWMLESRMFCLSEGARSLTVRFLITDSRGLEIGPAPGELTGAFCVLISSAGGWSRIDARVCWEKTDEQTALEFACTLGADGQAPVSCDWDLHGLQTAFPGLRILTDNRNCPCDWAALLDITAVEVETSVEQMRNFSVGNLLGELDPSQPFYPFGPEAGPGAWFRFGSDELEGKPLTEVFLQGSWCQLPASARGFTDIYKNYGRTPALANESFRVQVQQYDDGGWSALPQAPARLFNDDGPRPAEKTGFRFAPQPEGQRTHRGAFRLLLCDPDIGFGVQEYRRLFTEIMLHNSRVKEKKWRMVPEQPVVPMLCDLRLGYRCHLHIPLSEASDADHAVCLSRLGVVPGAGGFPLPGHPSAVPFISAHCGDNAVQLAFSGAEGERRFRLYFDLSCAPDAAPETDGAAARGCVWEYFDGQQWNPLSPEALLTDETCGFTRSGHADLRLPEAVNAAWLDGEGLFRLRLRMSDNCGDDISLCGVYTNYLRTRASGGDGLPLAAGTLQKLRDDDQRISAVRQPLPGYGGLSAETAERAAVRGVSRISTRNRALLASDYERLVLEGFPSIEKVCCLPASDGVVRVVVFSRMCGGIYPLTPGWMLSRIGDYLAPLQSPCAVVRVCNPVYRCIEIVCRAALKQEVDEPGSTLRRMTGYIRDYLAPWLDDGTLPEVGCRYSYKELHTRLANDPDIRGLTLLTVDGRSLDDIDVDVPDLYIGAARPWEVLLPGRIDIRLQQKGIDAAAIGSDFRIG